MRPRPHPFPRRLHRTGAWLALCLLTAWTCCAQTPPNDASKPTLITGIRTWKFVDGSSLRMIVTDVGAKAVNCSVKYGERLARPLAAFAPEHQAELGRIRDKKVKVVNFNHADAGLDIITPVGIPPYLSNLKQRPEEFLTEHPAGLPRLWTRSDGKSVQGCLINVSDDELAIWVNNRSYAVPVAALDDESLAYVQRVLNREELMIPMRFIWGHESYAAQDGQWGFRAYVSNDRAAAAYKNPTSFEQAVTAAREFMEEKFGDLRDWELKSVREFTWWNYPNSNRQPEAWKDAAVRPPVGRIFEFETKNAKAIKLAAQKLPNHTVAMRPPGYVLVPIFADGAVSECDFRR